MAARYQVVGKSLLTKDRAGTILCRLIKTGLRIREPIVTTGIAARKSSFVRKTVRSRCTSDRQLHKNNSMAGSSVNRCSEMPVILIVISPVNAAKIAGSKRERKLQRRIFRGFIKNSALSISEYQRMLPAMQDNKTMTDTIPRIGINI